MNQQNHSVTKQHVNYCSKCSKVIFRSPLINDRNGKKFIFNRLLILPAVSATIANADLRCPHLCQCYNVGQDLRILCSEIRLDHFPVDIPKTIKSLDVSSNAISNVSYKDLRQYPLLKHLDISSNNIQNLTSNTFAALTLLKELDLSFNKITRFHPNTFTQNRILSHLSIRGNPLQTEDDSPVVTSDSLKSLELDLATWSEHTLEKLTSLEQLTIHWKNGISMSIGTFQPLYRLREVKIICREMCDEETVSLSSDLKNYFIISGVKLVFPNPAIGRQGLDTNEEGEYSQGITKVSLSSSRQGNKYFIELYSSNKDLKLF